MHCCVKYLISSHAVLLAERLAVLQPAQRGPGVAPRGAAELDRVGGRHRVQPLLHLGRRRPVRRAWQKKKRRSVSNTNTNPQSFSAEAATTSEKLSRLKKNTFSCGLRGGLHGGGVQL